MNTAVQERAPEQPNNPFGHLPVAAAPTGALAQAAAQREVAEVQAAMVIAKKFPRDPIAAMDRILQSCARPTLAEAAFYQYSRGGSDISGASIRLLEEVCRGWGNIACGVTELARHDGYSECEAYAVDLETNFRDGKKFQVRHWRDTKSGGYKIKDERDIYELIANMGARRKRACMEAIVPGDVLEAAKKQCEVTLKTKAEVTPERLQSLLDKFADHGVTKEMIEKRIQRRIDAMTPALLVQLGRIFNSLKDGMSTPAEWFEVEPKADAQPQPQATGNTGAKAALAQKKPAAPGAPTIHDALKLVNEKKYDEARDMVKGAPFNDNNRAEIEAAIKKHSATGERV